MITDSILHDNEFFIEYLYIMSITNANDIDIFVPSTYVPINLTCSCETLSLFSEQIGDQKFQNISILYGVQNDTLS